MALVHGGMIAEVFKEERVEGSGGVVELKAATRIKIARMW